MNIKTFFITMLVAMALENPVFARALGINRWQDFQKSVKNIFAYGAVFTWTALLTTIGNIYAVIPFAEHKYYKFMLPVIFLMVTFIVYLITFFGIKKVFPKFFKQATIILPITTFNTALFGILFTVFNRHYTIWQAVAYAVGASLGYTLAMIIIFYAKKRLSLSSVPKSFRGTPIMLIYIGLLSLALYGLLGYSVGA